MYPNEGVLVGWTMPFSDRGCFASVVTAFILLAGGVDRSQMLGQSSSPPDHGRSVLSMQHETASLRLV